MPARGGGRIESGLGCRWGFKASWGIILGGILFSAYTAHGGMRSVTITDVFQFIVFIVGIPLMAYIAVEAAGGVQHIWATLPKSNLQVFGHKKFADYLPLFIIWSFLPVGVASPIVVQRMLMAQHPRQLRDQFLKRCHITPFFSVPPDASPEGTCVGM